ncbi:MAG: hypothetical protein ACP5G7_09750 [Anaerolineae bacterium]
MDDRMREDIMRLYAVDDKGSFVEYKAQDFGAEQHERVLEDWLEANPQALLEDSDVLLIGRQVSTEWGSTIDLLGVDKYGNVVVVELKRDRTPRDVLAQALEYAAYVSALDYAALDELFCQYQSDVGLSLLDAYGEAFDVEGGGVAFNKEQRVVIVAEDVTPPLRATASYIRHVGLPVTCVEFGLFETKGGDRVLSTDIVVGEEAARRRARSASRGQTNREEFMAACDEAGRRVHEAILHMAEEEGFVVAWGTRGYSMRVDLLGRRTSFVQGYPSTESWHQQVNVVFSEFGRKVSSADDIQSSFTPRFKALGVFEEMGSRGLGNLKWEIEAPVSDDLVAQVVSLLRELGHEVEAAWHRELEEA